MTATLAVVLAGLAAAVAVGSPRSGVLRSRLGSGAGLAGGRLAAGRLAGARLAGGAGGRGGSWLRLLGLAGLAALALGSVAGPVAAVAAGGVIAAGILRIRSRAIRARRQTETDVAEACLALAAELRAGSPPRQALLTVSADWPELLAGAAQRAALGGEVAAALRAAAGTPGASALAAVAAGSEVSERTGAAPARTLVAVADALRADAAARREADAQLATVRTTSRLLALLPVGTLLLLSGGGSALDFLFGSPYGLVCLSVAAVLLAAGMWWVDLVARSATRSVWET